jgi:hypothetical protein
MLDIIIKGVILYNTKGNLKKILITGVIITFLIFNFTPSTLSINVLKKNPSDNTIAFTGNILFAPQASTTTYLIDNNGNVKHTWESSYLPGQSVYMLENGNILRTAKIATVWPGGAGGGLQEITWNGNIIWDFTYYNDYHLSHHDIEILPNGNVLMIAWEYKTPSQAIAAGRNPNNIGNIFMVDHIIEVKKTGPTSGDIVWEWHLWDHLIQDYDPTKENYGVVADHPELIDINFGKEDIDWNHVNSIDYNEEFDQIILSSFGQDEIWVIDHSTTTEEAAGHTGGNSGKGGDILYRWGNPRAYRAGTVNDQKFFGQHDAQWIESGCPGEGNILVFNNGLDRPQGKYSSIDEIVPPVDANGNYSYTPGSAYGPEEQIWIYTAENPTNFYSYRISGAQRLSDGNTLICNGAFGIFFEVTPEKATIWEYTNPYPAPLINQVFKISHYESQTTGPDLDCEGSFSWENVGVGESLNGSFIVKNIGDNGTFLNWEIEKYPSWGNWTFTPEFGKNLTPEDDFFIVEVDVIAPDKKNKEFRGEIKVVNQDNSEDFDIVPIYLKTPLDKIIYHKPSLKFLRLLILQFPILYQIFA